MSATSTREIRSSHGGLILTLELEFDTCAIVVVIVEEEEEEEEEEGRKSGGGRKFNNDAKTKAHVNKNDRHTSRKE